MPRKFIAECRGQYAWTYYNQGDVITEAEGYPPGRWMTEIEPEPGPPEPAFPATDDKATALRRPLTVDDAVGATIVPKKRRA